MMEWITKSDGETALAASRLAEHLVPGDVVILRGEMGVGKTVFTKGLCTALGVTDIVTSPTFTVVNEYDGAKMQVYHFDLYRIEDEDELLEIGFEEYLQNGGVCVIEWPQNAGNALPKHGYEVTISRLENETERNITVKKI